MQLQNYCAESIKLHFICVDDTADHTHFFLLCLPRLPWLPSNDFKYYGFECELKSQGQSLLSLALAENGPI